MLCNLAAIYLTRQVACAVCCICRIYIERCCVIKKTGSSKSHQHPGTRGRRNAQPAYWKRTTTTYHLIVQLVVYWRLFNTADFLNTYTYFLDARISSWRWTLAIIYSSMVLTAWMDQMPLQLGIGYLASNNTGIGHRMPGIKCH